MSYYAEGPVRCASAGNEYVRTPRSMAAPTCRTGRTELIALRSPRRALEITSFTPVSPRSAQPAQERIARSLDNPDSFIATVVYEGGAALERQESAPEVHRATAIFPDSLAAPPPRANDLRPVDQSRARLVRRLVRLGQRAAPHDARGPFLR
jgi:hypothetical protein